MEQRSGIPRRGWGGIAESPCERPLGGGVRYDNALRILRRRQFLPQPCPRPSSVCPPPPPPLPYAVVAIVIVIAIVVPSAHLPSSSSPMRRDGTGSGLARQGENDSLLR